MSQRSDLIAWGSASAQVLTRGSACMRVVAQLTVDRRKFGFSAQVVQRVVEQIHAFVNRLGIVRMIQQRGKKFCGFGGNLFVVPLRFLEMHRGRFNDRAVRCIQSGSAQRLANLSHFSQHLLGAVELFCIRQRIAYRRKGKQLGVAVDLGAQHLVRVVIQRGGSCRGQPAASCSVRRWGSSWTVV